jgi:ribonucleoside-triphosphate reductase
MEQIESNEKVTKVTEIGVSTEESSQEDSDLAPKCPHCGSTNVYGMSRVVGYFSKIENWNKSKKAELKRRQKGKYWHDE